MKLKWKIKGYWAKFILKRAKKKGVIPKNSMKYYRALAKSKMDIR